MNTNDIIGIEPGSDNVYQDLGFADSEAWARKGFIVMSLDRYRSRRKWNLGKTARKAGVTRTKLRRILRGNFRNDSEDFLNRMLKKVRIP